MKKLVSLMLAVLFLCTMTTNVFAAEAGSITINGVVADADYEIYQLLDLHAYDADADNYYYTVNSAWAAFFETAEALTYVEIVDGNHVEWIADENDSVVATFAQKALAYAEANGIQPVKSSKNEGEFDVTGNKGVFSDLALGYYLVDSTVGALCKLTTTDPSAEIDPKNTVPTIDKQVQEDLDSSWGDDNIANIGEVVNFKTAITVGAGAENYVLHDEMDAGLTFVQDLEIGRGVTGITLNGEALTLGTDYTIKTAGLADACTFEVVFTATGMAKLAQGDVLVVSYNALLNENALVGADNPNLNETKLEYGDKMFTTPDVTETYTFSMDLIKTNGDNQLIDGAEFRIYDALTDGNEIAVVKVSDGVYRLAKAGETGEAIVVKGGKVTVIGFDSGVYYLEEVKAPAGYNQLTARKSFTITDTNLKAEFVESVYTPGTGVQVVNKTGSALPETGGTGTVIFVTVGLLAVLAAGVLLVTKKRMAMMED